MYRLYVDETGNSGMELSNPAHRFLSLTGISIDLHHVRTHAFPELERIKAEILGLDPDERIALHRKEIVEKVYPFHALRKPHKEAAFNEAILKVLTDLPYTAVTVVIDKQAHLRKYKKWARDPYHYCLRVLFERYCMTLWGKRKKGDLEAKGDVMAESRGKHEDRRLASAYEDLCAHPDPVWPKVVAQCITSKKLKIKRKEDNVAGLQIADLLAHPSALYVRRLYNNEPQVSGFAANIVNILRHHKYDRHQNWLTRKVTVKGYGVKWLP